MFVLDFSNKKHSQAYTIAAGNFLSDLGGHEGKELAQLLSLDKDEAAPEDLEKRSEIILWEAIEDAASSSECPYLYVADLIYSLTLDILSFAEEYHND
jgi:hypothetical protein